MTSQSTWTQLEEDALILIANLRRRFWDRQADRTPADSRFRANDFLVLCLREHLRDSSDDSATRDHDICLLAPYGLVRILAFASGSPGRDAHSIWSEIQYICWREYITLVPWHPADIPDGIEAFKIEGTVGHW